MYQHIKFNISTSQNQYIKTSTHQSTIIRAPALQAARRAPNRSNHPEATKPAKGGMIARYTRVYAPRPTYAALALSP